MSVNMKQNGSLTKIASLTKAIIPMGLAECYSTEERKVGCWTDGKPLYQKTIDFGALPNNTSKSVSHGIANIDKIVHAFGIGVSATSFLIIPFVTVESGRYQVGLEVSTTDVKIYTDYNRSSLYGYVTIQYTKTTDTAGSGIWTPSGAQAVHYSTAEQIIGTWIDGKPLYQKTKVIPFSDFTPIQGGTRYVCPYKEAVEEVKNIKGYAYSASYGYCFLGSKNYEADNTNTNYYWEFDNYYNNLNLTFIGNSASIINVSNVYITYEYTKTTD